MCHMFLLPVFETGSLRTFQQSPGAHRRTRARMEGVRKETERHTKRRQRGREGGRDERTAGRMRDRWRGERRWMDGREEG